MPSFDGLDPLSPDVCHTDRSAPRWYWHTKLKALNGGRDKLKPEELEFVGAAQERMPGDFLEVPGQRVVVDVRVSVSRHRELTVGVMACTRIGDIADLSSVSPGPRVRCIALIWPAMTLLILAWAFGIYAIIDGGIQIIDGIRRCRMA